MLVLAFRSGKEGGGWSELLKMLSDYLLNPHLWTRRANSAGAVSHPSLSEVTIEMEARPNSDVRPHAQANVLYVRALGKHASDPCDNISVSRFTRTSTVATSPPLLPLPRSDRSVIWWFGDPRHCVGSTLPQPLPGASRSPCCAGSATRSKTQTESYTCFRLWCKHSPNVTSPANVM